MLDSERLSFGSTLDTLADMLHVSRLEDWQKDEYFKSLKRFSSERYLSAIRSLQENYEPRSKSDFPVLGVMVRFCNQAKTKEKPATWNCRCCGIPFPAGSQALRCACNYWDHCFTCNKCFHCCKCGRRVDITDKISEIFSGINALLATKSAGSERERTKLQLVKPTK